MRPRIVGGQIQSTRTVFIIKNSTYSNKHYLINTEHKSRLYVHEKISLLQ